MYNEQAGIRRFLDTELLPALESLDGKTEVIIVDDGSTDESVTEALKAEINAKTDVKLVAFSKNFGKEAALTAGLKTASGEAVVMIDADGQHPAEVIPLMVKKWEEGARIVTAMSSHKHTKHKFGSKVFYSMMKMFGNDSMVPGAMDFRLLDREVVDAFNEFAEHNRITRGLIDWLGYPQEFLEVKTRGRAAGKATYNKKKLTALAVDSFVSMSRTPLLIFGYIGLGITLGSGLLGLFILIQQYILGDPLGLEWSGAVAMSVFVAFLVGLVLISQAITALYISQIHSEAKGRPLFVIDKKRSKGIE